MAKRLISIDREIAAKYLRNLSKLILYLVILAACVAICIGCLALVVIALHMLRNVKVNSDLCLKYINALKYPLLILFFGLFFHRPIKKFLNETESIDTKFGKLNRKRPSPQEGDPNAVRALSSDADEPLSETPVDAGDTSDEVEQQLTSPEAIAEYHRIFSIIWGSQLEALKKLESFRDGLAPEDLEEFLEMHKSKIGNGGFETVNDLMQYPVSEILAKYEPATKTYYLTYAGLYFLQYLRGRGLYDKELLY